MKNNKVIDWFVRVLKGVLIGTGFIMPGVSGGALAAIFGLYERLISFIAHLNKDFKENFLFFLPVGVGMIAGIVILAYPLGYFLEHHLPQTMWFFIGAIIGVLPSLWKQAGKHGRKPQHYAIMVLAFGIGLAFLIFSSQAVDGSMPQNFGTWALAGVIIALGVLLPGLSPSNLLLYMGMYAAMVEGFKTFDIAVVAPLFLGLAVCMLLFSKLVDILFGKVYAGLYHVIMGVVLASTVLIVPLDFNYLSIGGAVCILTCAAGVALGLWMSSLEDKYKPSSD